MPQMSPLMWEILFILSILGAMITASKNYFYMENSTMNKEFFNLMNKSQNNWTW